MNGLDATITLFDGGDPVPGVSDLCLSWNLKEVVTDFRDSYLGRDRKRPDKIVDGYDCDIELDVSSMSVINFLLDRKVARDANTALKELSVGITFAEKVGTFSGLVVRKCIESWEINIGSREGRVKNKIMLKAEDVESQTF
jgi:hypothetical protein